MVLLVEEAVRRLGVNEAVLVQLESLRGEEGCQRRKTEGREVEGAVAPVEACVSKCMPPEFAVLEVLKELSVYRATKGMAGERGAAELCESLSRSFNILVDKSDPVSLTTLHAREAIKFTTLQPQVERVCNDNQCRIVPVGYAFALPGNLALNTNPQTPTPDSQPPTPKGRRLTGPY